MKRAAGTGARLLDVVQRLSHEAAILDALGQMVMDLFSGAGGRAPKWVVGHQDSGALEVARLDVVVDVSNALLARAKAARDEARALLNTELRKVRVPPAGRDDEPPPGPPDVATLNRKSLDREGVA